MLGSLVVAQMEMVACEGLDGPIGHGAGCASALQSAVALRVPKRGGAVRAYAVCCPERIVPQGVVAPRMTKYRAPGRSGATCDTEIMNKLVPSPFWY